MFQTTNQLGDPHRTFKVCQPNLVILDRDPGTFYHEKTDGNFPSKVQGNQGIS